MDQYSHSGYNAPMPQSGYNMNNGYSQNNYSNSSSQMSYGQSTDYDHSSGSNYADYKWVLKSKCETLNSYTDFYFFQFIFSVVPLHIHQLMILAIRVTRKIIDSPVMAHHLRLITEWLHLIRMQLASMMTDHTETIQVDFFTINELIWILTHWKRAKKTNTWLIRFSEPYSQGYMKSDSYSSHAGYY